MSEKKDFDLLSVVIGKPKKGEKGAEEEKEFEMKDMTGKSSGYEKVSTSDTKGGRRSTRRLRKSKKSKKSRKSRKSRKYRK
jgi:hypothetical protein